MKKKTPDHKKLVAMENGLIPAFARIGKTEKRFLAYCIAQLNPMEETKLGMIEFRVQDFADVFDLPLTYVYETIRNTADTLNSRSFRRYENGVHKSDTWVWWSEYNEENGSIKIRLNERLAPLLLDLKEKQFIQFALRKSKDFTNRGWSLYVILKQWRKAGAQEFELDELKALMDMTGKYKKWYEFSRQVIEPAVGNINDVSDIRVGYEKIKKGRTIIGLAFTIKAAPNGDVVVDQASPKEELCAALIRAGLNPKTAKEYTERAYQGDKVQWLLDRIGSFVEKSQGKTTPKSYLQRIILNELHQGNLFNGSFSKPSSAPDHKEAQDCYLAKRQKGEVCKVRERGEAGNRKKCQICLEKLSVKQFGV